VDLIPATFVFLWTSSSDAYHRRQLEKMQRLLLHALKAVMPGTF
jgi:hypothetical protein